MLQHHCLLICLLLPVLDVLRGLMHRDIKPDNLLVSHILDDITQLTTDAVKVADFGISVLVPHGQVRLVNISSSPCGRAQCLSQCCLCLQQHYLL
jgi:serine/threonine protein kinase